MAYMKFVGKTDASKYRDADSFCDLIHYITNPEKAVSIRFANIALLETAATEMQLVAAQGRKSSGKKICHIVITFAPNELKAHGNAMVDDVMMQCLRYFGSRYQTVCAVHKYPQRHIHIVFSRVSPIDFKRFPDRYEDREQFRVFLDRVLCNYNVRLWKS